MDYIYSLRSGELLEMHGNLKSAYSAAAACYENPIFISTTGEPGADCKLVSVPSTVELCRAEIKRAGYFTITDGDDHDVETEIEKHRIIR